MKLEHWIFMMAGLIGGAGFGSGFIKGHYGIGTKLEQCESKLPRNQECILIAVPEYK